MKREGLLHPDLAATVAALGHGDTICVCDAGLPVPAGVPVIHLGYRPGGPPFLDVVKALVSELVVETATVATELTDGELKAALHDVLGDVVVGEIDHETFKIRTAECRAIVKTGEFTPFANVLLQAGVPF